MFLLLDDLSVRSWMCWNLFLLPPSVARFAASSVGSSTCSNPLLAPTPGGLQVRCWTCPQFFQLSNVVIVLHYGQIRSVGCGGSRWTSHVYLASNPRSKKTARPVLVRFSFIELLLGVVGQMPQVAKFRSPSGDHPPSFLERQEDWPKMLGTERLLPASR